MYIQPGPAAWEGADRTEGVPGFVAAKQLPNVPQEQKFQAHEESVADNLLRVVREAEFLLADEERRLAIAWRDRADVRARSEIIVAHLPLVWRVARRHSTSEIAIEDLFGEGVLALCKAIKLFDPDASNRFAAYAMKWVYGAIRRYICANQSVVRGSAFDDQIDPEPDNEGAQYTDDSPSPEDVYARERDFQVVNDAVSRLGSRERRIFEARRLTDKPITLKNLSLEFGVSIERVRQIEALAFEKVQQDVRRRLAFSDPEGRRR